MHPQLAILDRLVTGTLKPEDLGLWPQVYDTALAIAGVPAEDRFMLPYDVAAKHVNGYVRSKSTPASKPAKTLDLSAFVDAVPTPTPNAEPPALANGCYTVVFDRDDDYITLRIKPWKTKGPGFQIAEYLYGANNEADYTGFATIENGTQSIWARARNESRPADALRLLLGVHDREKFSHAYALKSGKCARCGRTLTVPASLLPEAGGFGPECRKIVGL